MKELLQHLFKGNILRFDEARSIMLKIGEGEFSEPEVASFLTVFKMRKIASTELAGFRSAMIELSLQTDLSEYNGIDIVGTGGDGKNTFNISTLAGFIIAGAGMNVTKHGNYAVSSKSGSSNLLEYFGYRFSNDPEKLKNDLDQGNFCFLHAPLFHPAMKYIAPVRRALKFPTFFNILGPMTNPSSPRYQVLGVNNSENFNHYKNVYRKLDVNFAVIHSIDGYDEISLTADTLCATNTQDKFYAPEDFGLHKIKPEKLYGGDSVESAARIFLNILKGNGTTEQNSVVLANAALGIKVYHPEKDLDECMLMARESLESKSALEKLKRITNL